jgi:hypothetical protein
MDKIGINICGQLKEVEEKFTTFSMQDTKKLA